jgi:hypothetical protein
MVKSLRKLDSSDLVGSSLFFNSTTSNTLAIGRSVLAKMEADKAAAAAQKNGTASSSSSSKSSETTPVKKTRKGKGLFFL